MGAKSNINSSLPVFIFFRTRCLDCFLTKGEPPLGLHDVSWSIVFLQRSRGSEEKRRPVKIPILPTHVA